MSIVLFEGKIIISVTRVLLIMFYFGQLQTFSVPLNIMEDTITTTLLTAVIPACV